jgi:hypothetical protein
MFDILLALMPHGGHAEEPMTDTTSSTVGSRGSLSRRKRKLETHCTKLGTDVELLAGA